jgi:hypothetical protein
MPYTTYPTGQDMTRFFETLPVTVSDDLDADALIADAVAEWETRTGWYPYLSTGQAQTRLFDPPREGRVLSLEGGLLSLSSLAIGVIPDQTGSYQDGVGTAGTVLVNNLNFYLAPRNAAVRGQAFTEVEFLSRVRGVPQSVGVTGVWGRVPEVPDDVWRVILGYGAFLAVPEMGLSATNGLVKVDDVTFTTSTGVSPIQALAAQWEKRFLKLASLKKRVVA